MVGTYNENPIFNLYNYLLQSIKQAVDEKFNLTEKNDYTEIDSLLKAILLNNGCKIASDKVQYQKIYNIQNNYDMYVISGMLGNEVNEYYDFLFFNGSKILVIFIDYFHIMEENRLVNYNEDDPEYYLKKVMGNSVYYDALKKIVEVFYMTTEPMINGLFHTSMGSNQRWNQYIIAIHILEHFKTVDENDVSDMPISDIRKIADGNIELQLYGIKVI